MITVDRSILCTGLMVRQEILTCNEKLWVEIDVVAYAIGRSLNSNSHRLSYP